MNFSSFFASPPLFDRTKFVELAGKTALITGASRGIGRATAVAFAEAGANIGLNYFSNDAAAEEVAADIRKFGRKVLLLKGDVADLSAVEGMVSRLAAEFGRLDLAVSNAAFSDREPFYSADLKGFRRTVDVTMWGAFNLLHASTLQMLAQGGGGAIVIVSSPHAVVAFPGAMAYNMSKAAIDHMARTAAIELTQQRIRVNIVHPGWIDTPGERKFASEETLRQAGEKLPWGRLGRPEEIARGILFLASPASDYITGSTLSIEGGITLPWWDKSGGVAK